MIKIKSEWIKNNVSNQTFNMVFAKNALAYSYLMNEEKEKAWETIKDYITTNQAGAINVGVKILIGLGKVDDAEKLIEKALNSSYSNLPFLNVTSIYLSLTKKDYSKASNTLAKASKFFDKNDWLELRDYLYSLFEYESEETIIKAFSELNKNKRNSTALSNLLYAFIKKPDVYLKLSDMLDLGNHNLNIRNTIISYCEVNKLFPNSLKYKKWLLSHDFFKNPKLFNYIAMATFKLEKCEKIVWEIQNLHELEQKIDVSFIMVLKALAVLQKKVSQNKFEEIVHYFSNINIDNRYDAIGKYLIEEITKEDLLFYVKNEKMRCEISYYIGVKEETLGNLKEAHDWYRISIETGLDKNGEYTWAYNKLKNRFSLSNQM